MLPSLLTSVHHSTGRLIESSIHRSMWGIRRPRVLNPDLRDLLENWWSGSHTLASEKLAKFAFCRTWHEPDLTRWGWDGLWEGGSHRGHRRREPGSKMISERYMQGRHDMCEIILECCFCLFGGERRCCLSSEFLKLYFFVRCGYCRSIEVVTFRFLILENLWGVLKRCQQSSDLVSGEKFIIIWMEYNK